MALTENQLERYSRHIILNEVGGSGQEKLLKSRVLLVGAGGLGSPAALYLAAAGVGTIGIADSDIVELTNLQRQVLHGIPDVGRSKVTSAEETLSAMNPDVTVQTHRVRVSADNIRSLIRRYDFVIDGTDNSAAKFLINDACLMENIPFSHGRILRFSGQVLTVLPGKTACYRCLFMPPHPPDKAPSCSQAGVLGVTAGVTGTLQAAEAVKYFLSIGELYTNRICMYDALTGGFGTKAVSKNRDCVVCGAHPVITELKDEAAAQACDPKNCDCNM